MTRVFHTEHRGDFEDGQQAARDAIKIHGVRYAIDKVNKACPPGQRSINSMSEYYYWKGYVDVISQQPEYR